MSRNELHFLVCCLGMAVVAMVGWIVLAEHDINALAKGELSIVAGGPFCGRVFVYHGERTICGQEHSPYWSTTLFEKKGSIVASEMIVGPGGANLYYNRPATNEEAMFYRGFFPPSPTFET